MKAQDRKAVRIGFENSRVDDAVICVLSSRIGQGFPHEVDEQSLGQCRRV